MRLLFTAPIIASSTVNSDGKNIYENTFSSPKAQRTTAFNKLFPFLFAVVLLGRKWPMGPGPFNQQQCFHFLIDRIHTWHISSAIPCILIEIYPFHNISAYSTMLFILKFQV